MARKAHEILKSRGYTDEELASMQSMLTPKFCQAIEAEDNERAAIDAERNRFKADLDATTRWYNEQAVPTINKALNDATTARSEAAAAATRLKAMQEYGLARVAEQDNGGNGNGAGNGAQNQNTNTNGNTNATQNQNPFDASRFVDRETFIAATDRFGDAIGVVADIAEDYRDMFGTRIPGGIGGLRKEYQDAVRNHRFNGDLREFAEGKFNFAAKRAELGEKSRLDAENKIRLDERQKLMSEMGNPMTRPLTLSRNPFTPKTAVVGGAREGQQQPWDRGNVDQRRGERVTAFARKAIEKMA